MQASGEGGILLVDLQRPALVYRPRTCRELGRAWGTGELGELEQGEELESGRKRKKKKYLSLEKQSLIVSFLEYKGCMASSLTSRVVRSRGATRRGRARRKTLCGGAREAVTR